MNDPKSHWILDRFPSFEEIENTAIELEKELRQEGLYEGFMSGVEWLSRGLGRPLLMVKDTLWGRLWVQFNDKP